MRFTACMVIASEGRGWRESEWGVAVAVAVARAVGVAVAALSVDVEVGPAWCGVKGV